MKIARALYVIVFFAAAPAFAQESGRLGLSMGFPSTVSFVWHATERIAVVPAVSFSNNSTETTVESQLTINGVVVATTSATTSSEGWSVSPGLDVRLYAGKWDNVSAYFAPGFTYNRSSSKTVTSTTSPFATSRSETLRFRTRGYNIRGAFGVQYTPHRRFAVFGEVGLRYTRLKQRLTAEGTSNTTTNASAVGAIFYF